MARYIATARTDWDQETAYQYIADFSSVSEWDPSIESARSLSDDPRSVGAKFEIESSFLGRTVELTYETIEIERPRKVVLKADTGTVVSLDKITFDPAPGGGTAVTYDADLQLKGPLKFFDPLLKLAFNRLGDKARDGLREKLAEPPPAVARS